MELKVTFVCDSKQRVVHTPSSTSKSKINFPKYEKSYEVSPSAIGYVHKATYEIPDGLSIIPGTNTYEGMMRRAFTSNISGNGARNITFE